MFTQEQPKAAYEVWNVIKDCMQRKNDQHGCVIWFTLHGLLRLIKVNLIGWIAYLKGERKTIKNDQT